MRRQLELVLAIVGILLVAGLGWAALIRPETNEAALAADRESLALAAADRLRAEIAERRELQRQSGTMRQRVQALDTLFPSRPETAELAEALQAVADQTGVKLVSVQPGTPTRGAATDPLARIPVQLSVVGGYFQLADFLNRLETLTPTNVAETAPTSRAVLVMSVSLTPGGAAGSASGGAAGSASGGAAAADLTAAVSMIVFQSAEEPAASTTTPGQSGTGSGSGSGTPAPTSTPAPGTVG
jgi:Tfp pilus assembly protein PilO